MNRRDKIISDLYNCKDLKEALLKMNPPELREDLKQEMFVVICDMNSEKLFELDNRGELRYYTVRIMLNLIQSKTSPFYYKFRKHLENTYQMGGMFQLIPKEELDEIGVRLWQFKSGVDFNSLSDTVLDRESIHIELMTKVKNGIENLSWYERDLLDLYISKDKNAALIARETGIPKRSIYHTLKTVRDKIKESI